MRKILITSLLFILLPLVALAIPGGDMTFKAAKSDSANQKIIDKGIQSAIEDMSFITRPIAKSKLEKTNQASKQIVVKMSGKKLVVKHDDRAPVASPADGKKFKWTREDGEVFMVTQQATDDTITQVYYADDGQKKMTYKFSPDSSKMTLKVKVESPKLSDPLEYSIDYAK